MGVVKLLGGGGGGGRKVLEAVVVESEDEANVREVLRIVRKQYGHLTLKQEKFCNDACVRRFLRAKGNNVKKASKSLLSCLAWRQNFGAEHLIADEFSEEIAHGTAYVTGDQHSRPVMVFRLKQDHMKCQSQKMYIRLFVFTMEATMSYMPTNIDKFVLLLDASSSRSASGCLNLLLPAFKIVSDYYPGRLAKAFIIDPPRLFAHLWKGVRHFVEISSSTAVISSHDIDAAAAEESVYDDNPASPFSRAASLRYDSLQTNLGRSFRFAFTVPPSDMTTTTTTKQKQSKTLDDVFEVKPWCLVSSDTDRRQVPATGSGSGPALVSPLNARSLSFASPAIGRRDGRTPGRRSMPSTPWISGKGGGVSPFGSISEVVRKESATRGEMKSQSIRQWARLYKAPYDEMSYRSKMRPPLGGLISIVPQHLKHRPSPSSAK